MKGIISALVTPFRDDEEINFSAIEQFVEKTISDGIAGFYVGGSTGEAFLLSLRLKKLL